MLQRLPGRLLLLLLLWVALPAAPGHAQAARSIDLFADLDAISLSAVVGGPLDLYGGTDPQLFAGDLRRFNVFKRDLTMALTLKLESCGILMDPGVPDQLSIEVFGRREELQQCTPRYVYMIQAKVLNSKRKARPADGEFVSLGPVIGIADEAGLEQALIETAVAMIADELRNCDSNN